MRRLSSLEGIVRKSVALALSGSGVSSDVTIAPGFFPVEVDQEQMLQVFNNILINAKEAMPQGGKVAITGGNVTVTEEDHLPLKSGHYARVSVKDKGIGIPQENLQRIFDPYFSTKGLGSQKGTGLGLSICRSIVKKHEGYISVESREGAGTTFHIWLPEASAMSGPRERRPDSRGPLSVTKRVLFMDDDSRIRNLIGTMMEYIGYEVEFARTGEEAVDIYRRTKEAGGDYAAVILDLTVQGGMGGDLAVRRMRELDRGVNAIISSGYADSPVIRNFRDYGFVGAIAKPYKIEELKALLDRLAASAWKKAEGETAG